MSKLHLISFPEPLSSTSCDTDKREGTGRQHKENVDHVRLKRSTPAAYFSHMQKHDRSKCIKCLPLQSIDHPIPLYQQQGSNRVGNDMSTPRIYFYASHSLSKNSWNELGFRRTGGSLPVGPLAPPIVPCLCCEPTRDLPGTPSLLSSRHPESIPKPQSSTITLMLCYSGGTLENSQQSAGAAQAW